MILPQNGPPRSGSSSLCKCPELFLKANTMKYRTRLGHISQICAEPQLQNTHNRSPCDQASSVGGHSFCALQEGRGPARRSVWVWCCERLAFFLEDISVYLKLRRFSPKLMCSPTEWNHKQINSWATRGSTSPAQNKPSPKEVAEGASSSQYTRLTTTPIFIAAAGCATHIPDADFLCPVARWCGACGSGVDTDARSGFCSGA